MVSFPPSSSLDGSLLDPVCQGWLAVVILSLASNIDLSFLAFFGLASVSFRDPFDS